MHVQLLATGIFQFVVQQKRREFAYVYTFGGNFAIENSEHARILVGQPTGKSL